MAIALEALLSECEGTRSSQGCNLPVDGEGPLLDGLDAGVDDGGLLDGVGGGQVSPGGDHVGALGDGADDAGAGHDVASKLGDAGEADDASLGGGDEGGEGSEEFHGDF